MRTIKPLRQSFLYRKFDYDKRSFVSIITAVYYDFETQKVCTEQELWKKFSNECVQVFNAEVLDLCGRKKSPELIVNGYAYGKYAKEGKTTVQVCLNNVLKSIDVWGDRYWIDGKATKPQNFDRIAISWQNAYGGEGVELNPHGKGIRSVQIGDIEAVMLPNIESPSDPIKKQGKHYLPVALGTLPIDYSERSKLMGTYDDKWRTEEFPGLAQDVDWSYFNQAPMDQRLASLNHGDEVLFVNMHPDEAELVFQIPHIVPKVFFKLIEKADSNSGFLQEVEVNLSTLWAFPHEKKAILIYEGVVEIPRTFLAEDVFEEVLLGLEHPDRSKSINYYEAVYKLFSDRKKSPHYSLMEESLLDPEYFVDNSKIQLSPSLKNKMKRVLLELKESEKKREELITLPLDSEFAEIGSISQAIDEFERLLSEGIDVKEENKKMLKEQEGEKSFLEQARELKKEIRSKARDNNEAFPKSAEDFTRISAASDEATVVSSKSQNRKEADQALKLIVDIVESDDSIKHSLKNIDLEALRKNTSTTEGVLQAVPYKFNMVNVDELSLVGSRLQKDSLRKDEQGNEWLNKQIARTSAVSNALKPFATESVEGHCQEIDNLSFFSEFKGNLFTSRLYLLKDKNFKTEDLSSLVVNGLKVIYCEFLDCDLSGLIGSDIEFKNCRFINCQLSGNDIKKSFFNNCVFEESNLNASNFESCAFDRCVFEASSMDKSSFTVSTLSNIKLHKCSLEFTSFIRSRAFYHKYANCQIKQVAYIKGKARELEFKSCGFDSISFVLDAPIGSLSFIDCVVDKAYFQRKLLINKLIIQCSKFENSSFRELVIKESLIDSSKLLNCDLSKSKLSNAKVFKSSMRESLMLSTVIEDSLFDWVDLAEVIMPALKTQNSLFKKVSFFSTEMAYVDIDSKTYFDDCYFERNNIVPKLREV